MKDKITYSALGSCVTRDIFGICDDQKIFSHVRMNGFVSPVVYSKVLHDNDILLLEKKIDQLELAEFRKRSIKKAMRGQTVEYICEEKSDYLIIDFYDIRFNILKLNDERSITYNANGSIVDKILSESFSEGGGERKLN